MTEHTLIPGFPGYAADRAGNIWSLESNWRGYGARALRTTLNASLYPSVRLMVNGHRKHVPVHKLVAQTFLGKPQEGQQLRHLDGSRTNNRPENLMWGSALENAQDRELHGRTSRGPRLHKRSLSRDRARAAITMARTGVAQRKVAAHFGVSHATIQRELSLAEAR